MKTELDGAFTKETWSIGPGGDGDTREAEEADKQLDAYYALGAMRKECEEQWEKLDGLKGEKIDRHRSDLRDLNGLIEPELCTAAQPSSGPRRSA